MVWWGIVWWLSNREKHRGSFLYWEYFCMLWDFQKHELNPGLQTTAWAHPALGWQREWARIFLLWQPWSLQHRPPLITTSSFAHQLSDYMEQLLDLETIDGKKWHSTLSTPPHIFNVGTKEPTLYLNVLPESRILMVGVDFIQGQILRWPSHTHSQI